MPVGRLTLSASKKEMAMTRTYKAVGMTWLAMVALSALAAHGALASPLTTEGFGGTSLTADQDGGTHGFGSKGEVKCVEAVYTSRTNEMVINDLTVFPSYPTKDKSGNKNCNAFGFVDSHVNMNGCNYTFTTPTIVKAGEVTWDPTLVHLICPEGKQIEITPTFFGMSACTQFIPMQTPTEGHVIGRNAPGSSPMDVTLEFKLKGFQYTGTGGPCGTKGSNGEFTGSSTFRCYSNEAHTILKACTFS